MEERGNKGENNCVVDGWELVNEIVPLAASWQEYLSTCLEPRPQHCYGSPPHWASAPSHRNARCRSRRRRGTPDPGKQEWAKKCRHEEWCVLRSSHVEGISHLALPFPPGRVQSLVAMLCAAPNLVSRIFLLGIYGLKRYEVLNRASEVGWLESVLETFHFPQWIMNE